MTRAPTTKTTTAIDVVMLAKSPVIILLEPRETVDEGGFGSGAFVGRASVFVLAAEIFAGSVTLVVRVVTDGGLVMPMTWVIVSEGSATTVLVIGLDSVGCLEVGPIVGLD